MIASMRHCDCLSRGYCERRLPRREQSRETSPSTQVGFGARETLNTPPSWLLREGDRFCPSSRLRDVVDLCSAVCCGESWNHARMGQQLIRVCVIHDHAATCWEGGGGVVWQKDERNRRCSKKKRVVLRSLDPSPSSSVARLFVSSGKKNALECN